MKINELSKLTGIPIETIRLYRKEGFLHPKRLANGYYDYSMEDYASLLHLKKLRSFDFSLEEIKQSEHSDDIEEYLEHFTEAEQRLKQEIHSIQQKIKFIHFERNHVLSSMHTADTNVSINQSVDEKIDIYPPYPANIPTFSRNSDFFLYTTTPIFISKDILNGPVTNTNITVKVGIGTYRSIYEKMHLSIPKKAVIIPNGICLSQIIRMHDLTSLNLAQLEPMMDYAKQIGKPFLSDTTGYLAGITYEKGKPVYLMRVRACIEKNDVISEDRI